MDMTNDRRVAAVAVILAMAGAVVLIGGLVDAPGVAWVHGGNTSTVPAWGVRLAVGSLMLAWLWMLMLMAKGHRLVPYALALLLGVHSLRTFYMWVWRGNPPALLNAALEVVCLVLLISWIGEQKSTRSAFRTVRRLFSRRGSRT